MLFNEKFQLLNIGQPTTKNTPEKAPNSAISKAKLIFEIFDKDHSGKIAQDEILQILRYMVRLIYTLFSR